MGRDPFAPDEGHLRHLELERRFERMRQENRFELMRQENATGAPRKARMPQEVRQRMDNARDQVARRLDFGIVNEE